MYFIAGTIEKTSINKNHAFSYDTDAFFQIHRSTAFLIHDANFQRVPVQAKRLFYHIK